MLGSLLLLQAAAGTPPPPLAGALDLRIATRSLDCPSPVTEGEVVVCGSREAKDPNRLEPLPPGGEDPQLRFRVGSATIGAEMAADRFGLATPTVRITIPF
jgi:hypothetical protein